MTTPTSADSKRRIYVIEYGVINTHAVVNLLKKTDFEVKVITSPSEARGEDPIYILPGVGNFDQGMRSLNSSGFSEYLRAEYKCGAKILGICLGFQMLGHESEEGTELGLGLLNGKCISIQDLKGVQKKVNNGWRGIDGKGRLGDFRGRFYFTHSFGYSASRLDADNNAMSIYSMENTDITAGIMSENLAGFQFHPERSHAQGLKIMEDVIGTWI